MAAQHAPRALRSPREGQRLDGRVWPSPVDHSTPRRAHPTDGTDILVGLDGSPDSRAALAWAADLADRRGSSLQTVTAQDLSTGEDLTGAPTLTGDMRQLLDERLEDELAGVRSAHPGLTVKSELAWTAAPTALVTRSRRVSCLVVGAVGSHQRRRADGELPRPGGVSAEVVAHARCPVVIVPEAGSLTRRASGPGPVVVGIDGSPEAAEAALFAFAQAALWERSVVAVTAWQMPRVLGIHLPELRASGDRHDDLVELVARALAPARAQHPGVPYEIAVEVGPTVEVLEHAAAHPVLIVVGSRGRGGFPGLALGSTGRRLSQSPRCPVAVVRTPNASPA